LETTQNYDKNNNNKILNSNENRWARGGWFSPFTFGPKKLCTNPIYNMTQCSNTGSLTVDKSSTKA
jgi:hypothetical protein